MKRFIPVLLSLCLLSGCKSGSVPAPEPLPNPAANVTADPAKVATQSADVPAQPDDVPAQRGSRHSRPNAGATPGQFDFYLFTLSWSPEFCITHPSSPECGLHLGYIVHGLWPNNKNGTYPEKCSSQPGPANPAAWSDIFPDASLLAHEWTTHGTCSGLTPDAYLGQIRTAFHEVKIPTPLNAVPPGTMLTPAVILGDLAMANPTFPKASFALSCGNNQLTAVEVCLSKTLQPIACAGVKTCRANVVKIAPHAAR